MKKRGAIGGVAVGAIVVVSMLTIPGIRSAHSQIGKPHDNMSPQGRSPAYHSPYADIDWERVARGNETTYHFNGEISGRVLLGDGKPASGFLVMARFDHHQSGAPGEGAAFTDAQGRYRIHGLNPQGFQVHVENGGLPYLTEPPRHVDLPREKPTAANIDLTVYLGPEVTVRVRDAQTKEPIAGVRVYKDSSLDPVVVTDAQGDARFRLNDMDTQFHLDNTELWGLKRTAAPGSSLYHRITLTKISGNPDATVDINTYLETPESQSVTFRGTVTGPDGKPVPGAQVEIIRTGTTEIVHGTTDDRGAFAIPAYRMQAPEYGNWDGAERKGILLVAEKGKMRSAHLATPEETWSTIPIRLSEAGLATLKGQVVGTDGKPLANVPLAYSEIPAGADAPLEKDGGVTDAHGRFELKHLLPGAYFLAFGHPVHNGNDFGFGTTVYPEAKSTRDWLTLKPGERRDVGKIVVYRAQKQVAGRLLAKDGQAARGNFLIEAHGAHTSALTYPDKEGNFQLKGLVDEPLTLFVFQSSDPHYYRTGTGSPDEVTHLPVRPGDETLKIIVP